MRASMKILWRVGGAAVLCVTPLAIGTSCVTVLRYLYISTISAPPCTTVLECEDGDSCPKGTDFTGCITTVGPRMCTPYDGTLDANGDCVKIGIVPIGPAVPGTGPDAGNTVHEAGAAPCANGMPGGGEN